MLYIASTRHLDNSGRAIRRWYEPITADLLAGCAGQRIRLVIDTNKVGFAYRLMTIGLAYKGRTLPLVWSVYQGYKGHTSVAQQVVLSRSIQHLVPDQSAVWVLGDSEFQSVRLLRWLGN